MQACSQITETKPCILPTLEAHVLGVRTKNHAGIQALEKLSDVSNTDT